MTSKEAYDLVMNAYEDMKVLKCIKYETLFVFWMVFKDSDKTSIDGVLNGMWSVDKQTKEVRDFKPFHIPIREYKNGKEVTDFA